MMNLLFEPNIRNKLVVAKSLSLDLLLNQQTEIPYWPGRDVRVVSPLDMPPRLGLSKSEGQIRLLHDLANIELQAMELCFRTLVEYVDLPREFLVELFKIFTEEAKHCGLALDALESLGGSWGMHPVHISLWGAVSEEDSILDRVLIVHRYLEGSGLDAGASLLTKLSGVARGPVHEAIEIITREELSHVQFGSHWYREFCKLQGLNSELDFPHRLNAVDSQIPRRFEKLDTELRRLAGFSTQEIHSLEAKILEWKDSGSLLRKFKNSHESLSNATFPQAIRPNESFRREPF